MKKVGTSPLNARIMVDYDKKDIKFSYPGGSGSVLARLSIISSFASGLALIFAVVIFFSLNIINSIPEIIQIFNHPNPVDGVNGVLMVYRIFGLFAGSLVASTIISYIIAWKYEYFASTFPKLQYFVYSKIYGVKEIHIKKIDSDEFILPTLKNIVLDYELKGDFADKIKYVNIVDYPYDLYLNGILHKNLRMWKAVFKFKKRPVNGSMVLRFI